MPSLYYSTPDTLKGKTLKQLREESAGAGFDYDPGQVARAFGISENTPLSGTYGLLGSSEGGYDIGPSTSGREYSFLQKYFGPGQTGSQMLANKQKGEEQGLLDRFSNFLPAARQRLEGELNLPALRQSAFDLTQTLKNLPSTVTGATRGFDVNENQRRRMISAGQEKIAPLAQEATAQQQFGEEEFGRRLGYELQPFQMEAGLLSDRLAREFTGYNQDQQRELDLLLAKMNQGFQVSENEKQRIHDLAVAESGYQNQKDFYSFQLAEQQKYKKLGEGTSKPVTSYLNQNTQRQPLTTLWQQALG